LCATVDRTREVLGGLPLLTKALGARGEHIEQSILLEVAAARNLSCGMEGGNAAHSLEAADAGMTRPWSTTSGSAARVCLTASSPRSPHHAEVGFAIEQCVQPARTAQ